MHRKWLGLCALIPGVALVFLDQTILPVALPAIQRELGATNVALQWAVNSYLLTIAMFVLAAGKFGDRIGHRACLQWGMALFTLSSTLCGFSPNIEWLIGARALQGVGAALLFPMQSALLVSIFPPNERGRATGLNVSISSVFMILGPLIGGYLTEMMSWRWIFWINLPIAAAGFLLSQLFLPATPTRSGKIDLPGFLLFACGSGTLITAFMQAREWGWTSPMTLLLFLIASLCAVFLIQRERNTAHPFLDLTLFKHPSYTAIALSVSIIQFILMITVFRAIYFQTVLDYTPTQTGLLTFISCLPVLFCSPIGGILADRASPKLPIAIGFVCLIYSFFWLAIFSTPTLMSLLMALIAFGIGIPLIFTPSYSSAMSVIPPQKMGVGFGMLATLRNFCATMGVASIGLLIDSVQAHQFLAEADQTPGLQNLPTEQLLKYAEGIMATPEGAAQTLYRSAQIDAFSISHYTLGFLLIAAFAIIFILYRRKPSHPPTTSFAEGWD